MPSYKFSDKEFEEQAWQSMKSILDQEMPEKKSRKGIWILGLTASIGLSLAGWFLYQTSQMSGIKESVSSVPVHVADVDVRQDDRNSDEVVFGETSNSKSADLITEKPNNSIQKRGQISTVPPVLSSINKDVDHSSNLQSTSLLREAKSAQNKIGIEKIKSTPLGVTDPGDPAVVSLENKVKNKLSKNNKMENQEVIFMNPSMRNSDRTFGYNILIINKLPKLKWTSLVDVIDIRMKSIRFMTWSDSDETLVNANQNKKDLNIKYGLFANAQTSVHSLNFGWNTGAHVIWKPLNKIGFCAHVDYSQLNINEESSREVLIEDSAFLNGQRAVPVVTTRGARLRTLGLGLDLNWYVDDRLYFGFGATYRVNADGKTSIQNMEQFNLPDTDNGNLAPQDIYASLDLTPNSFSEESNFGNTWAAHVDLTYQLTAHWGIHAGVENYFSDFNSSSAQTALDSGTNIGINSGGLLVPIGLNRNNIIIARTGLSYTF